MKIKQNYQQDIIKSKTTSLLIELSKKDLNNFDDTQGLNYSINIAKKIYNHPISNLSETNMIFIDGADVQNNQILLFNKLLDNLENSFKDIKNINALKETISAGISVATGGILGDIFGSSFDI